MLAIAALFFCSGVSALIYQVLWLRTLGWVFGVTVYAASTVWACFMGGLALGSLIAGRLSDRVQRPLRWFGVTELLVGVTALATPIVFQLLQRAYVAAYPSLARSLAALTFARFLLSAGVLIVPTTLMGATLPLVLKSSAWRDRQFGAHVGVLYASNTAGAIVGTLAAGLYLIPGLGIRRTFLVAAMVNLTIGVVAVLLGSDAASRRRSDARLDTESNGDVTSRIVLGVFGVSGFVSLALEVVWFRVLTLFLRPTVYGFAIMLATILAGIAIGSYIVTPLLDRRIRWIAVLALLEMAIGTAAVLSFRPVTEIDALSNWLTPILSHVVSGWLAYQVAGSVLAIFPTAVLMGIAFPIGLRVWAVSVGGDDHVGQRIGQFYSLNVAGAIVGSLAAGFVMLPALGSHSSLTILAALTFVSGVVLLAVSEWARATQVVVGILAAMLFITALRSAPEPFDQFVAQRYPDARILWKEEGIETTVVVHDTPTHDRVLTVNGNHQASTDGSTSYVHRRIGHLPMALHPDPRAALVIGLGGGATAGAVSVWGPSVDIVELSGSVVRAAAYFGSINYGVLSRPNVRLRVDDGRNYLMLTPKRYDVVTADVIHPIFVGSGNLYSVEYFQLLRRVLNAGGIVVQWVAGTDAEYKIIARTFLNVFPHTTVWGGGSLLVGTTEPLRLRRADFEAKQGRKAAAEALHDLNVESFDALLGAFDAGPEELRAFVGDGPLLTDDKPVVEYFLSLPRERDVDTSSLKGDVRRYVVE
jgi:spermidine synthase